MKRFYVRTEIISGEGSIEKLAELNNRRICVVTDSLMIKIGLIEFVIEKIEGRGNTYKCFSDVEQNPTVDCVTNGLYHILAFKPDVIISLGGGSVIDTAKAIMYFCIKVKDIFLNDAINFKPLFIAIPTTSGTGSEVTSYAVITDQSNATKHVLSDGLMRPDIAILDAKFTLSVPKNVTVDTGFDVITHAIEAYVSKEHDSFSDIFAQKAIELVFVNLARVYYNGENFIARQAMHEASTMAGIAFDHAGLGINHSLAHAIGGSFSVSHGRLNAILLPKTIAFNATCHEMKDNPIKRRYEALAAHLGLEHGVLGLIEKIENLKRMMEVEETLAQLDFDQHLYKSAISEMAEKAFKDICTVSNPRAVTLEDLEGLLSLPS